MKIGTFGLFTLVTAMLPVSMAMADYDVSPSVMGSKIQTNAFTDDTEDFVPNVRVFDFGFEDPTPPLFTQDPGFHPLAGSGFSTSSSVRVSAVSGLSYYSGSGPVSFGAAPSGSSLQLEFGSGSLVITDTAPGGTLNLGAADAAGEFDRHLGSTLANSNGDAADGFYLVALQLSDPGMGLTASDPFYVLYGLNADDGLVDPVKIFVRDTFAPGSNLAPIPEPATVAPLGVVAAGLLRRRRVGAR